MRSIPAVFRSALLVGVSLLAGAAGALAQVAATPANATPVSGDTIISLSPFLVSGEGDTGYQVQRTVTGSRSAKELKI